MTVSKKRIGRCLLSLALACGAVSVPLWAADTGSQVIGQRSATIGQQVATAEDLKSKALEAVRAGKFDLTHDYLSQAVAVSKDPKLAQMADWAKAFEEQRQQFAAERHKEYEKAAKDVHLLVENDKDLYAMEHAARAYLLADDKAEFRKEPWVVSLLTDAKKMAQEFESQEQWVKALRLYSQLSAIEPEIPDWKEHLKTVTRRVRLLALYTPDELKRIQEPDTKEREAVDKLLKPEAEPADAAAAQKKADEEEEEDKQQKIDWRDTLRDVKMDMLLDALMNARQNYYRDVNFKKILAGGLQGLRVVLTTPALEQAFPGLGDAGKRAQMLGIVDGYLAGMDDVKDRDEADKMHEVLSRLSAVNLRTVNLPEQVLVSEFADGAFAALDPFSNIIWPSDWEEFQKRTKGEFSGVGIQIQSDESGNLKVASPLEDSPAYKAGIKPDYVITHIDGKSARWITLNQAVKKITGAPGTTVVLTIKDTDGNTKDYSLKRETIKVSSIKGWIHKPGGGWDYYIDPQQKIGYMRMTDFTRTTGDELERAVKEMTAAGARGMILDLRYNPGGLLNAATDVVDRFITKGTIVKTSPDRVDSPNRPTTMDAKNTRDEVSAPLIVLVNQYSASASEIVSGALKDHKRATIVGERTFGKGSVQMLYPLGDRQRPDSVLKLTTSHYYLPSGKLIHREENSREWGVEPDVTVEMTPEQMRAAIDARQDFEILRDAVVAPAGGANLPEKADAVETAVAKSVKKDPLAVDAQLSAALLLMRLQLAAGGTPL